MRKHKSTADVHCKISAYRRIFKEPSSCFDRASNASGVRGSSTNAIQLLALAYSFLGRKYYMNSEKEEMANFTS